MDIPDWCEEISSGRKGRLHSTCSHKLCLLLLGFGYTHFRINQNLQEKGRSVLKAVSGKYGKRDQIHDILVNFFSEEVALEINCSSPSAS